MILHCIWKPKKVDHRILGGFCHIGVLGKKVLKRLVNIVVNVYM